MGTLAQGTQGTGYQNLHWPAQPASSSVPARV